MAIRGVAQGWFPIPPDGDELTGNRAQVYDSMTYVPEGDLHAVIEGDEATLCGLPVRGMSLSPEQDASHFPGWATCQECLQAYEDLT